MSVTHSSRSFREAGSFREVSPEEHMREVLSIILEQCVRVMRLWNKLMPEEHALRYLAHTRKNIGT